MFFDALENQRTRGESLPLSISLAQAFLTSRSDHVKSVDFHPSNGGGSPPETTHDEFTDVEAI